MNLLDIFDFASAPCLRHPSWRLHRSLYFVCVFVNCLGYTRFRFDILSEILSFHSSPLCLQLWVYSSFFPSFLCYQVLSPRPPLVLFSPTTTPTHYFQLEWMFDVQLWKRRIIETENRRIVGSEKHRNIQVCKGYLLSKQNFRKTFKLFGSGKGKNLKLISLWSRTKLN